MKARLVLVMLALLTGICGVSKGSEDDVPSHLRKSWEIGAEILSHKYEEFSGGTTLMEDTGILYGVVLNTYRRTWIPASPHDSPEGPRWMKGFEGELAYGTVDYDGQLQNGTPYKMNDIEDWLVDIRVLAGPDYPKADRLFTPYLGLGYRHLRDDSSSDPAGYLRQSNYLYLPIGLQTVSYKTQGWSFDGGVEADILLYGLQISRINNFDHYNEQFSGYGFRVSLNVEKKGDTSGFKMQPFVRFWHIDDSEPDYYGVLYEPENETTQYGLRLIWTF